MSRSAAALAAALVATALPGAACSPLNYTHPVEPYTVRCCVDVPPAPESLRVVTFNIKFALAVDSAIAVLEGEPKLRGADIVLLQEMDAKSARKVAKALGMNAVYYPAVRHPRFDRDFGNAILSRHRILRHRKEILPHTGRFGHTQRIAVRAILLVGERTVAVTSFHLATPIENGPGQRGDQIDHVVGTNENVAADLVLVGGDLNSPGLVQRVVDRGYVCPTRGKGPTSAGRQSLDHVFVRRPGGDASDDAHDPAGVVSVDRRTSDHDAVWVVIPLDRAKRSKGS